MAKKGPVTKLARAAVQPELVDQLEPQGDEQLAAAVWPAIREFFANVAKFFTEARALEQKAVATLERAKQLKPPTDARTDVAIQEFVRTATAQRKEVEAHWTITSKVHQFHRKLTAARDRAVDPNQEAADLAQKLHNRYVDEERRRAEEETRRRQREEEEKAARRREAELQELEAQRLKAEAASEDLSERERLFVEYVFRGTVPSQAAHRAGYKDTTYGVRLMEMKKIQKALEGKREAAAIARQAEARSREPLIVDDVEEVKPNVERAAGAVDRSNHYGDVINENALIAAAISGGYGVPIDILRVDPAKVNEYARSLRERIGLWPGVKYRRETRTV